MAYGTVARLAEPTLLPGRFKKICRQAAASPIILADASPAPILNGVRDKASQRLSVLDHSIDEHVEHVMSHEGILARVQLVLFSGLGRDLVRPLKHAAPG
jgi:hypothetical protein